MTKWDKVLIVFIAIISISSLFYVKNAATDQSQKYVSVQVDGEEIKKIIFDKKIIGTTIAIETKFGYNLIEIGDEEVRVIEADCPDQLDVKQGYISRTNEIIVCLPNRLVIEIKGETDDSEVDYMTH